MRLLSVVVLLACLAAAACTRTDTSKPDDSRFGGFYGGVNGGVIR